MPGQGAFVTNDGVTVDDYIIQPEQYSAGVLMTLGVYAHEYGHALGLPDFYDTVVAGGGLGQWSLMSNGGSGLVRAAGRLRAGAPRDYPRNTPPTAATRP